MKFIDAAEVINSVIMVILFFVSLSFCIYRGITDSKQKEDAKY